MLAKLWKRLMLKGTDFAGTRGHSKIKGLYALKDPWDMASDREQSRFAETNAKIAEIAPRFGTVMELGCGEGHQSAHLATISDQVYGIDVSATAIERAKTRCPSGIFEAAPMEEAADVFPGQRFDLITACEVLYYAEDIPAVLATLQARTETLFVTTFGPHADKTRQHFQGANWTDMGEIAHGETRWECFVWRAPERAA